MPCMQKHRIRRDTRGVFVFADAVRIRRPWPGAGLCLWRPLFLGGFLFCLLDHVGNTLSHDFRTAHAEGLCGTVESVPLFPKNPHRDDRGQARGVRCRAHVIQNITSGITNVAFRGRFVESAKITRAATAQGHRLPDRPCRESNVTTCHLCPYQHRYISVRLPECP